MPPVPFSNSPLKKIRLWGILLSKEISFGKDGWYETYLQMTQEERAWLLAKLVCVEEVHVQRSLGEALWL